MSEKKAPGIILETDLCSDVDDVGAIAILFDAAARGKIRLIGVSVNVNGPLEAAAVKALLRSRKLPEVPVCVWNGPNPPSGADSVYVPYLARLAGPEASGGSLTPETFYREILSGEADGSVQVISIGFFCNLAAALRADKELFARKVSRVVAMAGSFREKPGYREFNVTQMRDDAAYFVENWPGETVFVASETGDRAITDLRGEERFAADPVWECYRLHTKGTMRRPSWDLVAVDWALNGEGDVYTLSEPGRVSVTREGITPFLPSPDGKHRYLIFTKSHEEIGRHITKKLILAMENRKND